MSEQTEIITDEKTIKQVAKIVHRRPARIRELVESGVVSARKIGGSQRVPRLTVSVAAVQIALARLERYQPKRATVRVDAPPSMIHPAAMKAIEIERRLQAQRVA